MNRESESQAVVSLVDRGVIALVHYEYIITSYFDVYNYPKVRLQYPQLEVRICFRSLLYNPYCFRPYAQRALNLDRDLSPSRV